MTILHHVSDEFLVSYEAGSLTEGWSLAVATHLALCPSCRVKATLAASVGGALLDGLDEAEVDDRSLETVLSRIGRRAEVQPFSPAPSEPQTVFPQPLRDYVGADLAGVLWRRLGRGSGQFVIRTADRTTSVRLLKIAAGRPVPVHGHRGGELTIVLGGKLVDGNEVFGRGDAAEANEEIEHQPAADSGEDCICLAVTDAPLRFKSLVARLVQPFLGI